MQGITKNEYGWLVRLQYLNDCPKYQRFFKFNGDEDKALEQAKKYRDRIEKKMSVTGDKKRPYARRKPQSNNKTGHLGVSFHIEYGQPNAYGERIEYSKYKSYFIDSDEIGRNFSFSCNKYGDDVALQLAILTRRLKRRATLKELNNEEKI
jgi:hypothetical protein